MVAIGYSRCPVKFLIWMLFTLLNSVLATVSASLGNALANVTFSPQYLDKLHENSNRTVWIKVSFQRQRLDGKYGFDVGNVTGDGISNHVYPFTPPQPVKRPSVVLNFKSGDTSVARVMDPPATVQHRRIETFDRALIANGSSNSTFGDDDDGDGDSDDDNDNWYLNTSFTVKGLFLGKTKIHVQLSFRNEVQVMKLAQDGFQSIDKNDNGEQVLEFSYDVWVVRPDKKLAHTFVGTLMILLIVANMIMGAQLNLTVVYDVIKKPLAPMIGFFCQFLVMPLTSFGLAKIIFTPVGQYNLGLGLFTAGCCPGGGASNAYTVLLDGNVDLSITMTFLSTLLSLVTMPFWMFALGRQFLVESPSHSISVPYDNICYSLLMLVLPLCAGTMVRRFWPKLADRANKLLRPFLCLIILFICTFGVYVNLYMFRLVTWRVLLGGMGLPWLGFALGLIIAVLSRQPQPNVVAISIETGIQNTGIAIMLLQLSFMQPDADLAAVLPVVVAMFTPAPMITALVIHYIVKCRKEKKKQQEKAAVMCNGNGTAHGTSSSLISKSDEEKHEMMNGCAILDDNANTEHHHVINEEVDGPGLSMTGENIDGDTYANGTIANYRKIYQNLEEKIKMLEVNA